MTDLQEFQCDASETISQDDEDEVEELQNSLREVVQDPSVKPKLQCLMVDPAFSMVTVQSEDSGIVWETASSRCSTPWASETSSISEAYSMEGSGAAGKITIVFDEEKIIRRRTRSGGRSSRLGDRFSRPGSSRSASALGVERPEMAEVSIPNVKRETAETEPDLEDIKNKDQQLFSLISEGYEILNIRVPSKLPTVDEEESTDLPDNLSYLDQTPKIKSRKSQQNHVLPEEGEILDHQEASEQDSTQLSADTELRRTPTQKETTGDIDYFEKFTLVDVVVPGEQAPELQEETERPAAEPQVEEQKPVKETAKDSPSVSEDSFVFVTDVEIAGEHLDEVFYGEGASAGAMQQREDDEADDGARMRTRRESQRSGKESGSVLFGSEETTLTPIFISSGPPKIIDPILLEEPTAMSFMYSDLYEDAVGERRKSDGECSEAESVASERRYKRRLSDSEEADGYLEKFTLKDEIPTVEVQPEPVEDSRGGRMMWSQSKFEMTGCLTRVVKEEDKDKTKTEEPQTQEISVGDRTEDLEPATFEEKKEAVTETEKEEAQLSVEPEESTVREASIQVSIQESKEREDPMQDKEVKHEVKREQTEPPQSSADEPPPKTELMDSKEQKAEESEEHQINVPAIIIETEQLCQTQEVVEKTEIEIEETAVIAPVSKEEPQIITKSEMPPETTEKSAPEEAATDTKMVAADEKVVTEVTAEASAEVKEPETAEEEQLTSEQLETSAETSKEAAEVAPEDVAPVEVITDCDAAVHAVVEVTEKAVDEKEIQTQVQIDLQEGAGVETTYIQSAAPEAKDEALTEESQVAELLPEADQVSEAKTEISSEVAEPVMPEVERHEILQQNQQEDSVTESEPDKTNLMPEAEDPSPTEDTGAALQEAANVGDELILLVPKGQAVEMDIEISTGLEKPTSETAALFEPECIVAPETTSVCPETPQAPNEESMPEPHIEVKPQFVLKEEALPINELDDRYPPPAPVEEERKTESDFEKDEDIFSPLRSFTPREDLSTLHREDVQSEEFDYEMITEQDAKEIPKPETQRDEEEKVFDVSPEEVPIEADYEIIDAEEEGQARLAAELEGMDWFCLTCSCLLSEDDCASGEHRSHEVTAVDKKLSDWISELQGRSENIEDLVSELELAYNSVEVNQADCTEAAMQVQNEEMMALVMEQYNNMSVSMEEEKKAKLEQLYDQIVSFQESIDSAKASLETTAREAETDAECCGCVVRLSAALDTAMSMELGPKGLLVFEDYAKGNTSSSHLAQRKGIPVPQRPTLQPQEPGSATSASVTVYWKVNPGDIIDCFQVYCMEDPQGAVSEEYRVTVKESYCVLEELEPDKTYKVWVMAVNYTGCSLPSERLDFRTAPSVPVIDTESCTVMWDSATLRWSSAKQTPEQSYTLEYCRQYELEGEGLRSISGIQSCEQKVVLQPNENYLFYIKAVNEAGASEQSEAALISTKGTRFHLLKASAHPALELSEDQTTLHYSLDFVVISRCPSILGELLLAQGHHYWETIVSRSAAYRLGVAYSTANRSSPLGENSLSWCLHLCSPCLSSCRYQLLHTDVQSSVFVIDMPERVGTLLDYQLGRLSFYNAQSGQLLGTFCHRFTQPCHPALALDMPGSLEVSMVLEAPEFTKDS
uniref:Cardiomyopathy associated 5 n=1 Tax=Sparus aurata TaxID=8175 RepID=A0A671UWF7_SPAAU